MGTLIARVSEGVTGRPAQARIYLTDETGRTHFPDCAQRYICGQEQHFVADRYFALDLPAGPARLRAERGPEFVAAEVTVDIPVSGTVAVELAPTRWASMADLGWYSADLHVHRSGAEMPLIMRAEDLNLASVIATRAVEDDVGPDNFDQDGAHGGQGGVWREEASWLVTLDALHCYSRFDHELERIGPHRYGAVIVCGLRQPVLGSPGALWPTDADWVGELPAKGAHVDAEKPFWAGTPVNVALGFVGSMGVVCNHLHRGGVWADAERWGSVAQPPRSKHDRRAFVLWVMDCYYRFLDCGFRLPVTGGSASGIMPNPVGYNRTYAKLDRPFTYDAWFEALRCGRSFATNGPMLELSADGHDIGQTVTLDRGVVHVEASATSASPLESLEVVLNGHVVASSLATPSGAAATGEGHLTLSADLEVGTSGWLAARCFERCATTERCAHTSPLYLARRGRPNPGATASARYFLDIIDDFAAYIRQAEDVLSAWQRTDVLATYSSARTIFQNIAG